MNKKIPCLLLLLVVTGLMASLPASAAAPGSGAPVGPVQVAASIDADRVVAYGHSQLLLIRYVPSQNPGITRIDLDGSVDRSFAEKGTIEIAAEDATVTPDGKILVSTFTRSRGGRKSDARITRLLADGRPDPSFGAGGSANVNFGGRYDTGQTAALMANGKILLAGSRQDAAVIRGESDWSPAVARLRRDGSLDRSFGRKGVRVLPGGGEIEILDIARTPDGGVVVEVGNSIDTELCKLTREGSLDAGFGKRGCLEVRGKREKPGYHEELFVAPQFAVLPSGRLLLAATGYPNRGPDRRFRAVAVRLRPNGRIDRSYGDEGWAVASAGRGDLSAEGLTPLADGGLAIAATIDNRPRKEQGDFGAIAFRPDGRGEQRFGSQTRCRAKLAGDQEVLGAVTLGRRVVVVGSGGGNLWVLRCPPLGQGQR